MTTVWVVEEGYYSDKQVVAVFSTKEAAQAYVDETPDTHMFEIEVDAEPVPPAHPDGVSWEVRVHDDGRVLESKRARHPQEGPSVCRHHGMSPSWYCEVRSRDREHAIKVAMEQAMMAKAHDPWIIARRGNITVAVRREADE